MRRNTWGLATALLLIFSISLAIAEESKVYINGIDANFPPFTYMNKAGKPDGFDVKALDWIAKDQGFKVKHQPMDWDEIIPSLKTEKIDIVASGMSITDARKKEVAFSIIYWKIEQALVARKDAKITVAQALADGNKIGVQRGTAEAKWIEDNLIKKGGNKFLLIQYDSALLAVEDVVNGRIMAAVMDDSLALDTVKKRPVKILGTFGMPDEDFGYAIRKEDTEFMEMINKGLQKLMQAPYWAELKRTYIDKHR